MINVFEALADVVRLAAMQVLLAREWLESGVAYNPVSAGVAIDPYAVYRRLRERDPIHRMKLVDAWVLTRYEDADAVLRDHRRFANDGRQRCLPRRADRNDLAERRGGARCPE